MGTSTQIHTGSFASVASAWRIFFGLLRRTFVLPVFYLLWDLLSSWGTSAGSEQGLSLLAALGTAGGLGYLAAYAYRNSRRLSFACSVLAGSKLLETLRSSHLFVRSADWPLLVALLFGPFFVLLAGLGGWV